ncbi:MAG: hypothetical protein Q7U75_13735, partial [Desulfobacterales bacterium]|nr:hypothetical protein [Desulfobacterales bacterium]
MAKSLWGRTRTGSALARVMYASVAFVLVAAMMAPGVVVYASEGESTSTPEPVAETPQGSEPQEPTPSETTAPADGSPASTSSEPTSGAATDAPQAPEAVLEPVFETPWVA